MSRPRLFNFFLFVIFSYNLIPSVAGFRILPGLLINFQKLILLVLILGFVLSKSQLYRQPYDRPILIMLIMLIVVRFLSIFSALSRMDSFLFWFSSIFYWYFFYYAALRLMKSEIEIHQVIKVFFLSGVVITLFNFIEGFTGFHLPSLFPGVTGALHYWVYERASYTRVFGLLADPVATAYYLVPAIPFGLYLSRTSKYKLLWIVSTVFMVLGVLLNLTRVAILALGIMALFYGFFTRRKVVWVCITLVIFVLFIKTNNPARALFSQTFNPMSRSSDVLQQIYFKRMQGVLVIGPYIVKNLPLFGYGTGALVRYSLMEQYFQSAGYLYDDRTEFPAFYVVSMESGILAGLSFFVLFILAISKSFKTALKRRYADNDVMKYICLSLVGYFVCLLGNGVFTSLHLFFLLLGVLNVKMNSYKMNGIA